MLKSLSHTSILLLQRQIGEFLFGAIQLLLQIDELLLALRLALGELHLILQFFLFERVHVLYQLLFELGTRDLQVHLGAFLLLHNLLLIVFELDAAVFQLHLQLLQALLFCADQVHLLVGFLRQLICDLAVMRCRIGHALMYRLCQQLCVFEATQPIFARPLFGLCEGTEARRVINITARLRQFGSCSLHIQQPQHLNEWIQNALIGGHQFMSRMQVALGYGVTRRF